MDLKICSLNVRGLGDKLKRREMFYWLRRKNHSIFMLQEVHCSENTMSLWTAEWGYKTLFSCCTSAKGGVAILFNNNFDLQLLRTYLDPNGRFIICDITAYADDTTLILDGSTVSFTTSLQILDLFSEISGLRLNNKKTVVLWIGANTGKETNLAPEKDFKWVKDKVKALGVWLSTNPATTIEANYNEKLTKVRNSLSCWEG